jgi:hypothetical protein
MNLSDDVLNAAFLVYEEWGPNRRINRTERLAGEFKELSSQEIEPIMKLMSEVSHTIGEISELGGEAKLGRANMAKMLQKKHPFLKGKGLAHALFLINYYACHEGYDK